MDDKHDPNAGVPIGTFTARTDDGQFEIPIEVVTDDEIEARQLSLSQDDPLRFHDDPTRQDALPRRKRVATLLGVPLPGTLPEANDPTRATRREINAAVDSMLEEQPTSVYGARRRDSESSLQSLESLLESEMIELPPSHPPGEIVGVSVARETETGTFQLELREADEPHRGMPVLAPAQFIEARQRDQSQSPSAASAAAARAAEAKSPRVEKPARTEKAEPAQVPISSLAPREIARPARARREPASAAGIGLVAAMVLLGIGGWWWTAGGYKRMADSSPQPAAAARPTPPPSEPLASAKVPSEPEPVVAAPAPTPPPVEPAEHKPRVASKTVRKVAPPPPAPAPAPAPADSMAETPSRSDVLNGLDGVRTSVQACAEGRNGVAEVDLTIAANGVVTNALVGGDFGGTPQGSCIARAVRRARFPVFKQDRYRVLFPYVL